MRFKFRRYLVRFERTSAVLYMHGTPRCRSDVREISGGRTRHVRMRPYDPLSQRPVRRLAFAVNKV